jgi:hypothetical protein
MLKKFAMNLFINLKNKLFSIIDDNQIYLINQSKYVTCLSEIIEVLTNTLTRIEDIYYKYILFPKLQAAKAMGHIVY